MNTSLILHPSVCKHVPANSRPCLETHGLSSPYKTDVNLHPAMNLTFADFDTFLAGGRTYSNPDTRRPSEESPDTIQTFALDRIINLILGGEVSSNMGTGYWLSREVVREILWRARIVDACSIADSIEIP